MDVRLLRRIPSRKARFFLNTIAALVLVTVSARADSSAVRDLDSAKPSPDNRPLPEFRSSPLRGLDAMIDDDRLKSQQPLTPQQLLEERKKRLQLPAEAKSAGQNANTLPMDADNKVWEAPLETRPRSRAGFVLVVGILLGAIIVAWKTGWFLRKPEKSSS